MNKKIIIFLPDGVGLRNFAFTNFHKLGKEKGYAITYWNNTIFPLKKEFGYEEIKIDYAKSHIVSEIYKRARKEIELKQNVKNFNDTTYFSYQFPQSYSSIKKAIKSIAVTGLSMLYNSEKGLEKIRNKIFQLERKTTYYQKAKAQLIAEKPALVFCTNQRPLLAIAPLLAAQDLGIPTATFIFSWDNLPKATLVVQSDYYYVWSEHMKTEMLNYYPHINKKQLKIVGTPQFEPHFNTELLETKEQFFKTHKLDSTKKYICFSGDDITTSPYDAYYLEDVAIRIKKMNENGANLGIVFRRCPVDFSDRFDAVLETYKNLIIPINPDWKSYGNQWNKVMPTPADFQLLANTIKHTELVINVGSSMVFDAVCHNKPCIYINYNHEKANLKKRDIHKIYKYIHFKSMPSKKAVLWFNSKEEIQKVIEKALNNPTETIENAKKWFEVINIKEPTIASENSWKSIQEQI